MNNKFRVWNKINRQYETDFMVIGDNGWLYRVESERIRIANDNHIVELCTGLSAAKSYRGESEMDRLIFEGDICEYTQGGPFVIEIIETTWLYGFARRYLVGGEIFQMKELDSELKIIGNIHTDMKVKQ